MSFFEHPWFPFLVTQIEVAFACEGGADPRLIRGTGFWLKVTFPSSEGQNWFITNRHNVDSELASGKKRFVYEMRILMRSHNGAPALETEFVKVPESCEIFIHDTDDVAVITFTQRDTSQMIKNKCSLQSAETGLIANDEFWQNSVNLLDPISFIGFPGAGGAKPWYDTVWNLPIARSGTIASHPNIPYKNSHFNIKTENVCLASGLSFSGSSGSPVWLNPKGIDLGPGITGGPKFVPARLIGIMSGHGVDRTTESPMHHAGLSYFTRSTSIWDLVRGVKQQRVEWGMHTVRMLPEEIE